MNTQASSAIENGFTAQLMNRVTPMPRQCRRTWPSAPKSTLTSMGITMTQISSPTGRFTWATSSRPMAWKTPGSHCPSRMPATIHKATQRLR